jgi:hypothetical protein
MPSNRYIFRRSQDCHTQEVSYRLIVSVRKFLNLSYDKPKRQVLHRNGFGIIFFSFIVFSTFLSNIVFYFILFSVILYNILYNLLTFHAIYSKIT